MVAHTLGNPFDLGAVSAFCSANDLWLVEDCCDALGSEYEGRSVGTFGDLATVSFYPAHHMTMGEGGCVITNSGRLKVLAESFRDWGRDCWCDPGKQNTCGKRFGHQQGDLPFGYDHKYIYSHVGYNLKLTDMQAAVGVAQLDKLEGFIAARRANFALLSDGLADLSDVLILPQATSGSDPRGQRGDARRARRVSRVAADHHAAAVRRQPAAPARVSVGRPSPDRVARAGGPGHARRLLGRGLSRVVGRDAFVHDRVLPRRRGGRAAVRVCVVGAGVAGLVCAYELTRAGHVCDVYERWPGLGGQAATFDVGGGARLERYYHHLFTSDKEIVALCEELGLGDEIEWRPSSVAFFARGRSWPFTGPLDLLRFKPLSVLGRLRMGLSVLRLQRAASGGVGPYEGLTAASWVRRSMGSEAWEVVWGPLLRAKFGPRAEDVGMSWLWNKLTMRRQLKGREARIERLGYPRRSFEPLFEALVARVHAGGGRVLVDRPVVRVGPGFEIEAGAAGSWRRGHTPESFPVSGAPERYDAVVLTTPNAVTRELLSPELLSSVGATHLEWLGGVEYHTAVCLLLELDRQFSPFYWTNIADPALPFLGLIEHTNLVEPERYGGRRFLYVANYVPAGDPLASLEADALLEHYTPGLRTIRPDFASDWVRARWLFREPAAQPVVTVGYGARIPPLTTGVPELVLANTTQIYPEDRGTNYSVRLGRQAAAALEKLPPSPAP
jgi:protoporphyrinogen oxidase